MQVIQLLLICSVIAAYMDCVPYINELSRIEKILVNTVFLFAVISGIELYIEKYYIDKWRR